MTSSEIDLLKTDAGCYNPVKSGHILRRCRRAAHPAGHPHAAQKRLLNRMCGERPDRQHIIRSRFDSTHAHSERHVAIRKRVCWLYHACQAVMRVNGHAVEMVRLQRCIRPHDDERGVFEEPVHTHRPLGERCRQRDEAAVAIARPRDARSGFRVVDTP